MGLPEINEKLKVRRKKRARAKVEVKVHTKAIEKLKKIRTRLLAQPMRVSAQGVRFISEFEGFLAEPSDRLDGHATVGYGHLIHFGKVTAADRKGVWVKGQQTPGRLTRAEGQRLLAADLADIYEPAARALFRKGGPLHGRFTQARLDALISLAFNLGVGALVPKPHPGFETLGAALQKGDLQAIPASFRLYDRSGGHALPGLTRRRAAEAHLFRTGNYTN